jgi:imidazolonepropionase-like amidohydrolase
LAGTDNVGLFDELEAYAEAGVPTFEILRAATINGANWLGAKTDFGTIEPGKRAHLILVDGDPLEDISELRNIDLVVKDGVIVFRR